MDEVHIKNVLEEFRVDKKAIEQLRSMCKSVGFDAILNIAFQNKMYDVILNLFKPIEIDDEIKMYFDIFTYLSSMESGLTTFLERFEAREVEKQDIINEIYAIDLEKIRKMKIENTLPRQIMGYGHPVNSINEVIYYAEPACLEAMLYLFNMNIKTTMNDTECVYGDIKEKGKCVIWIDYDSLSKENKQVAHALISKGLGNFVSGKISKTFAIQVPCTKEETVGSVSDKLKNIIHSFVRQPILYGFYNEEQMLARMKKYIYNSIYYNVYLPNGLKAFDYCIELIESGKVRENSSGNLQTEDGKTFLMDDFVNVIANSTAFVQSYIDYFGYYYAEEEKRFWESKGLYERVKSKKANGEFPLSQDDTQKGHKK